MNILTIHFEPLINFSFSILKKDEVYKVIIEMKTNKTLIFKIFDLKDNLLLTFNRMLLNVSIFRYIFEKSYIYLWTWKNYFILTNHNKLYII